MSQGDARSRMARAVFGMLDEPSPDVPMLAAALITMLLVAATVSMHAAGLAVLLRLLNKPRARPPQGFWSTVWLLVRVAWALILIHMMEISIWALFYLWKGCMPDAESAFYFAGVTYTTVGYGDLVLPQPWRLLGPVEGLTGILMCGLSTAFFFAVVNKIFVRSLWPASE